MFTPESRAHVSIVFRDREGNERSTALSFPFDLSDSLIAAYMDIWIGRVRLLTNAAIVSWSIMRAFDDREFVRPIDGSVLYDRTVLYYRSASNYDQIIVPSARMELMEISGTYDGIRLDMNRADVVDIIDGMQDVVTFIVDSLGEPFPDEYLIGGLML